MSESRGVDESITENVERQCNELALLESMYPSELTVLLAPSKQDDCKISIEIEQDAYSLGFELSRKSYPRYSVPDVQLSCTGAIPEGVRNGLQSRLNDVLKNQEPGIECVDSIVVDFKDSVEEIRAEWESQKVAQQESLDRARQKDEAKQARKQEVQRQVEAEDASNRTPTEGLRVVLWMHHLLATAKRKAIVQNSKASSLAGFSKPGYPGAVYVEGESSSVREFVDDLKSMRWQAIQERGTQTVEYASLTLTSNSTGIVEVESLGDIAEGLRKQPGSGPEIADFFLECMKIK
ncbi:hypothetical protein K490DRAFT_65923 [Saccharata proteae CBS 121410]|uniref:RWD domain-containing protein n=1 Tax=Saccharata proteae CBS 121410 TaxID=1314787 RepID=A0A9P4HSA1_9PEZI|nr:hypothetical protein K490DRAFT_65923 [Saccharata proteae CBS 121410]